MSNKRITPFVKRMRTNGGTIYTFSSAVEDIGLNINERNNVVKISHFALLDIPQINEPNTLVENRFNVNAIAGAWEYAQSSASLKEGRVLIAESFQNYALNFESVLLSQNDYNASLVRTVSERVFWKWLKETGAIRWDKDTSYNGVQYWAEEIDADGSLGYNNVVKYIGQVSAGNVRSDTFGTYNETYILVPTSHGQTDAYFKIIEDDNYKHGMQFGELGENILGREGYTLPHPDALDYKAYYDFVDSSTQVGSIPFYMDYSIGSYNPGWWYSAEGINIDSSYNAYLTDSSSYLTTGIYNVDLKYTDGGNTFGLRRSSIDCLSLVFDLDELKGIYNDQSLTYDKMAITDSVNDAFNFNAALIYYTVYNSTMDQVLGRNLLGFLIIDAPNGNSSDIGFAGITIPSLEKIMSGPGGFGTSYSFRLNIKTDNITDDTQAIIVDQATSDQLYAEDWTQAFDNLNTAVNIMTKNNGVINYMSQQYIDISRTQTQIINDLDELKLVVNDIGQDITGTPNSLALFALGNDPLVDSSVYMRFGNVGIKNNNPLYPLHISGTTKADEIIIENSIKDTSGNILLGYGSPLQLGSSTNYRDVNIFTGGLTPALKVDSSNNINIERDLSIGGNLYSDGSSYFSGSVIFESSIYSSYFDFSKKYLGPGNVGGGLQWDGSYFNVVSGGDVSAAGSTGDIQYNIGGNMNADSNLNWSFSTTTLSVNGTIKEAGTALSSKYLGISNTATNSNSLGGISAGSYLRSDANDSYTAGTLTFASAASVSFGKTTGTSPFTVASTTVVTNLNADLWDGNQFSSYLNQTVLTSSVPTFSGLTLNGNISFGSGSKTITGGSASALHVKGGDFSSLGANLYLYGGEATLTANNGNVYVGNNGTEDFGQAFFGSTASSSKPTISWRGDTDTGIYASGTNQISIANGGTERFRFASDGTFHADADIIAYSSSVPSDINLKENVRLLGPSLDKILKLNPVEYDLRKNHQHHIGLIAQDVEKVIPEVIKEAELLGESGKFKTINYEEIIPYLINSIKEQQKIINDLKEEILNLKK